jgi:glycosyltransferase involved in cell wall biosynthesis
MKVAMIISSIPPDFSGAGRTGWRMAKGFKARGLDVVVLTMTQRTPPSDGIRVVAMPYRSLRQRLDRLPLLRRIVGMVAIAGAFFAAIRTLRTERPDVVHQMGCDPGPQLLGLAASLLGIPVVAETTLMGSDDPLTMRRSRWGRIRFAILRRCRRLVCVSPRLRDAALSAGVDPTSCIVIGNDVAVEHFRPVVPDERASLRTELGLPIDVPIVISVGYLGPRKGMLELAQVFVRDVLRVRPDAFLLLVGPFVGSGEAGAYCRTLIAYSREPEAAGRIRLVGEVPDVAPWMRASDAFAFASREEGFGTVVAEALAVGLPTVVRDIPGISGFILGQTPYTEIVETDAELAPALIRLLDHARQPDAARVLRRRAVECFSEDVVFEQYLTMFDELVRRWNGTRPQSRFLNHEATIASRRASSRQP